jgi:hypothetical protein
MKPSKSDPRIRVKISGLQLTELQEHTGAMGEAFGLDRKIERYKGKRPITLYHWDLECLLDVLNWVLNDKKQYPDQEVQEYIALHELHVRLKDLYRQTFPS